MAVLFISYGGWRHLSSKDYHGFTWQIPYVLIIRLCKPVSVRQPWIPQRTILIVSLHFLDHLSFNSSILSHFYVIMDGKLTFICEKYLTIKKEYHTIIKRGSFIMIEYKINVIEELKKIGVNTTKAKKTGVFGQDTMRKFKNRDTKISVEVLNRLCCLLEMQPRDILKYVETEDDRENIISKICDK